MLAVAALLLLPRLLAAAPAVEFRSDLTTNRRDGYRCYNSPSIVQQRCGPAPGTPTLLVFLEMRKGCSDNGFQIDIGLFRSTDAGRHWQRSLVHSESTPTENVSLNCAAPVVDGHGRLHLLMTRNNFDVLYTHSDSCGDSWAPVQNISAQAKAPGWGWVATTFSAIQLNAGPAAGRLVVGCDHADHNQRAAYPITTHHSHVMYSDDRGRSWRVGGSAPLSSSDEASIAQLSDGRIVMNSRNCERCTQRASFDF